MTQPPLNIDYWASLYPAYTDYAEGYKKAMEQPELVDRAERLWNWKGLDRSVPFGNIADFLGRIDQKEYITQDPEESIESLSTVLKREGIVESNSLVTSAFLLHLMASEPDRYSIKYPIYDRRVWNAYVYLWRVRKDGERLYRQASQSPSQYGAFCRKFKRTCPDDRGRDYERALFMLGGFIMSLPPKDAPTPISRIDEKLKAQEEVISRAHGELGYSLVDIKGIAGSG